MNDQNLETLPGIEPAILRGYSSVPCLVSEQPQARIEAFGRAALSDGELVALVLQGAGVGVDDAKRRAVESLAAAGGLAKMAGWDAAQWRQMVGMSALKAAQMAAVSELGRRMIQQALAGGDRVLLDRPAAIAEFMGPAVAGLEVEKFWVLCLDRKNRLLARVEVSSGSATAAIAHPREVFRAAIRESAAAIACVHNHPSGDPTPSSQDLSVTRLLREAGKAVDVAVTDHVIVGRAGNDPMGRGYYSFREGGLL